MKVWIVMHWIIDERSEIVSVHLTEESAKSARSKFPDPDISEGTKYEGWEIEEVPVTE